MTNLTKPATLALLAAVVIPVSMLQARQTKDDANKPIVDDVVRSSSFVSDAETKISKSFNVAPGTKLSTQVDGGNIDVETSDRNQVDIEIERKVTNASEADALKMLKAHQITISQEAGEIRIRAKRLKSSTSWLGRHPNLNVHYKIVVPKKFDVALDTGGGNVNVADLQGKLDTTTGGGNVTLGTIQGPVQVRTGGGNIGVADCSDKLNIETGGGNVNVQNFSGSSIQARTGGGTITADLASQPKANSSFETGGGNINLKLPETVAANLDAATGGGRVRTDLPVTQTSSKHSERLKTAINGGGPALVLRTGGGGIEILKR